MHQKRDQCPELHVNVHSTMHTMRPCQNQPPTLLYPPCAPWQDKESLLSQKGQAKARLQELTSLCERQRSQLAEAKLRARELDRLASAAKADTRLAEDQVREASVSDWEGSGGLSVFFPPVLRHPICCFPAKRRDVCIHHGREGR